MEKIKNFFKNIFNHSKVIIIILLCIILLQMCSRCSHRTKDQWREHQYTEEISKKDSVITGQKTTIDSLNIALIQTKDSLKMCNSKYEQVKNNEKSLQDDKALMREIIRKQNKN